MIGVIIAFEQTLKLPVLHLLMIFRTSVDVSFWWTTSEEDASDDVNFWWSSEPLVFRTSFLQTLPCNSSFLFVESIALICSSRTYAWIKDTKFLSMVLHTWTNMSISNWHFLIPFYLQNSKGNVKHILFQQSPPFWWWQTLVLKCSIAVNLINKWTIWVWGL